MSYANVSMKPFQTSMTSAAAVGGMAGGRSWRQIVEDAGKKTILELKIIKTVNSVDGTKSKNLTFDDLATFIFDVLKIDFKNCFAFDYSSGRYDFRYI